MDLKEFMEILDAIRFETEMDDIDELRGLAKTCYPLFRRAITLMEQAGIIQN